MKAHIDFPRQRLLDVFLLFLGLVIAYCNHFDFLPGPYLDKDKTG